MTPLEIRAAKDLCDLLQDAHDLIFDGKNCTGTNPVQAEKNLVAGLKKLDTALALNNAMLESQ